MRQEGQQELPDNLTDFQLLAYTAGLAVLARWLREHWDAYVPPDLRRRHEEDLAAWRRRPLHERQAAFRGPANRTGGTVADVLRDLKVQQHEGWPVFWERYSTNTLCAYLHTMLALRTFLERQTASTRLARHLLEADDLGAPEALRESFEALFASLPEVPEFFAE